MSHLTGENLLESLVRITEERSQDSLEISLINSMLEILPAQEIALIKVFEGRIDMIEEVIRARLKDGGLMLRRTSALDPGLAACLEAGIGEGQTCCGSWLYHPLMVRGRLLRVLMFRCDNCSDEDARLIDCFLAVYRNYVEVLYDSERDTLTGLLNRKTFDARITEVLAARIGKPPWESVSEGAERRATPDGEHWLGILDIDHFKRINDTHGHLYGDEVLLLLSQIMRETFRASDLLFRYGGEEFVVVLEADQQGAMIALERFRRNVETFDFPQVGTVTVSVGAVEISANDIPSQVVGRADQAMYHAKANGRNRVCTYEGLVADGRIERASVEDHIELF